MTRKKVKLAWIDNDGARRASFRKRRAGLIKKVSELRTLCDVDASVVIYSPDEIEPTVWPSQDVVQEQFMKFKSMPQLERMKKMSNHETYLRDRVSKSHELLSRIQRRNKESDMNDLMHQIHQGKGLHECSLGELNGLTWFCDEKMKDINRRIEFHQQLPYESGTAPPPPSAVADETAGLGGTSNAGLEGDRESTSTESLLLDQWFMEMMKNNNKALKGAGSSNTMTDQMGYPCYPFANPTAADDQLGLLRHSFGGGSSSSFAAADMELEPGLCPGNFRGPPIDMGLPPFRAHSHGAPTDHMGLQLQPHGICVGGSNFGPFGTDIGLGLCLNVFSGQTGSSSAGSELRLTPLGLSESSSGSTGADAGVPSDGKTEPERFARI